MTGHVPSGIIPLTIALMVLFFGTVLYQAIYNKKTREAAWLALAGGTHAFASMYGGLGGALTTIAPDAERYVFVGQSLLACSILCLAATGKQFVSRVCWVLVTLMLIFGISHFRKPVINSYPFLKGPLWSGEVTQWEKDHSYGLHVWPGSFHWIMYLDGSHTPEQRMQACPLREAR
ncbi:hypothetical protein [Komagataeibacter xylinus]|uniref:Uncharacterized protein n=1 Tax=Komagataeibacter xylinus TaxID=28448 RepID=A0A857FLB1_KOMXY|nr:hypothetical protein [Komagataeibacter xylinus]QHC34986.1 hypothetical protein FMA36_05220 [Komagataeibacter xylinus]